MIKAEDLTQIGKILKPHGIKGELNVLLDKGFDPDACEYLICQTEGLFVPLYIERDKSKAETRSFMKFEGIDSVEEAEKFYSCNLYIDSKELSATDDDKLPLDFFIGYKVYDGDVLLGEITEIDYRTANILCVVNYKGKDTEIPFTEDFIVDINRKNRAVYMNLPQGLLEINN